MSILGFDAKLSVSFINGRFLVITFLFFLKFLTAIFISSKFEVFLLLVLYFFNCFKKPSPTVPNPAIPIPILLFI